MKSQNALPDKETEEERQAEEDIQCVHCRTTEREREKEGMRDSPVCAIFNEISQVLKLSNGHGPSSKAARGPFIII